MKYELDLSKEINKIFTELVAIKSDTGTTLEKDIEKYLYNWFQGIDYFQLNPDKCGQYNLEEDHLGRSIIWGLVKGKGNDTVILIHHHDVVDVLDYGVLSEYAYSPDELKYAMRERAVSSDVKKDLKSEKWIFGRGTCDMKAGAAIQLALMEAYSKIEDFNGNVLLISVPDEECLSLGMREGAKLLVKLKEKFNLQYCILINLEPHQREENNKGILYEGSVGKIMPVVYVRGKKTHAGDIFQGLNPIMLLSEIVKVTELNSDFSDVEGDEITPPPSWLYFRDRKERYDVSIPESAGGYFSILTLQRTPKEILDQVKKVCEKSFEDMIENMNTHYKKYSEKVNHMNGKLPWKVNVRTFSEIYDEAVKNSGDLFIENYNHTLEKLKKDIKNNKTNMPESNFVLIEKTLEYITDLSPMVVIAFSPPYYPHIANIKLNQLSTKNVLNLSEKINDFSRANWNEIYEKRNYFMGISDMSYIGLNNSEDVIPYIEPNMPLWGNLYSISFEDMKKLSIPVINIGPWGKDLHKFTERVYKEDLLERTPKLLDFTIQYILKRNQKGEVYEENPSHCKL
ncbi:M20/M25/M40 family metallo-hydrolase [Crassaminicella profunda]|uniref:M20/M25/M40 family metallo-hydrolase n=1 Tax=Crassaminicella profunda TaxID=1286698 RepID=UPI001CA6FF9C|nr:M20/M25/M40 family metallo-hydrolase [Crassaminicella profunda]QZY56871.1 M20/M25/M40 family metallo-hydrolase [Crassaminicella profunda]